MNKKKYTVGKLGIAFVIACSLFSCTRDIESDTLAPYPNISDVFIDGFSKDMDFQAWGMPTNFSIDNETKYDGTASIRIEVPGPNNPLGNWSGGNLFSKTGRDLTQYDALTFYAKASVNTTMEAGFGNDGGNSDYLVTVKGVKLDNNWKKIIIPIPNAAKLTSEKGLFYYSAGQVNNEGYSLWIDDVKFEKLGTLAHPIIKDVDKFGFSGKVGIGNLTETINLPNGVNQTLEVSPKYFTFTSSNTDVASVSGDSLTINKVGETVITAKEAEGQIKYNILPSAPVPEQPQANVISLLSGAYQNAITANWNPHWNYSTAEVSDINKDKGVIKYYTGLNFVGIVFNSPANCAGMDYMHLDVMSQDNTASGNLSVSLYNGSGEYKTIVTPDTNPDFVKGKWCSIDIPLTSLGNDKTIPQLALACSDGIRNILLDNIYFYKK